MSNERQIAANRRNSQLSTGPRTPKGKLRVALNPLKHGLTAEQIVLLPYEDPAQFDAFRKAIWHDLDPQGAFEAELAQTIVVYLWRLRRIPMLESAMYTVSDEEAPTGLELMRSLAHAAMEMEAREKQGAGGSTEPERGHERVAEAQTPLTLRQKLKRIAPSCPSQPSYPIWRLLSGGSEATPAPSPICGDTRARYSDLSFRTLHELQRLQAKRAGERVPAPAAVDIDVNINRNWEVNPE